MGASSVTVSELTIPKAGFSNETIVGRAEWTGGDSGDGEVEFVLRIEPTSHQLFMESDALRQARVMSTLTRYVPVPTVWHTEDDGNVFGAPFFMMKRVHGRIPGDVPSWHQRGWTAELDPVRQRALCDHALAELVELHRIDTSAAEFAFFEKPGDGTALQRYIEHIATWYEWCEPVLLYGAESIAAAMDYVSREVPDDDRRSVVWGDARVGNIIFADDLSVAALLDWEGAALGPPEIDVAWWVMFDEFLCEAQGISRLAGVYDRRATFARYEELSGVELRNTDYFEVLAGLQLSLINSRLADLLISTGKAPESMAAEFVTRVAGITRRSLERATG